MADGSSYDEVPYVRAPHPQSHPDRLATIATLHGMSPTPIDRCRVLELGCAGGANLIPMAANLPNSQFVGVDLSATQIAEASKIAGHLQLGNIHLQHADVRHIDASWGQFDYIIAHGVYSWIPSDARDQLLAICATNLAENGVAYVSYNTYPGWHMLRMVRDIMRYQAAKHGNVDDAVNHARALIYFLSQSNPRPEHPYAQVLAHAVKTLDPHSDTYIFHEYLEEVNEPVYFEEFIKHAQAHRLQYVSEADLWVMTSNYHSTAVNETISRLAANPIERQQYLDFLHGRQYRESILCHSHVTLQRRDDAQIMNSFHISSSARSEDSLQTPGAITFHGPKVGSVTTGNPILKTALTELANIWPMTLPFSQLEAIANARVYPAGVDEATRAYNRTTLAQTLLGSYFQIDLLELHVTPAPLTSHVSERPYAMPFARSQAADGPRVTSQRHEFFVLTEFERYVLWKLDGTRDHGAIRLELSQPDAAAILARAKLTTADLPAAIDTCLIRFARHGLLVR